MTDTAMTPAGEAPRWTGDDLAERLRAQGTRYHNLHPFHVRMDAGELTRDELQRWVANRFYYQECIPIKDAAILSNCPEVAVRREWIQRIVDHDGAADGTGGIESWLRLGEALGVTREELVSERHLLPGVRYAVNAYVDEPRMTQDVDILSTRAADLAEELRSHLASTFRIAARVRVVAGGKGFRIFQLREPKNRHLADVRQIDQLPPTRLIADVLVPTPEELIAQKVIAFVHRRGQPKAGTDWRDVLVMLQAHPALQQSPTIVRACLQAAGADAATLTAWDELVALDLTEDEDAGY